MEQKSYIYVYICSENKHICILSAEKQHMWRAKVLYLAQLWRSKVRLIETTISKKADFGNYKIV